MQTRLKYTAIVVFSMCLFGVVAVHVGHLPYTIEDVKSGTFFERMFEQKPSEIGDTLAGIFGSLAFIAAAIAVVMQSFELAAQRNELRLTREVLKDQREATRDTAVAQQAQVDLLAQQSAIFVKEQAEREKASLARLTDELVASLRWKFETTTIQWVSEPNAYGHHDLVNLCDTPDNSGKISDEQFFAALLEKLNGLASELEQFENNSLIGVFPKRYKLRRISLAIKEIDGKIEELSETEQTRLGRLRIKDLKKAVLILLKKDDIWDDSDA